jgi:hypothetical protein
METLKINTFEEYANPNYFIIIFENTDKKLRISQKSIAGGKQMFDKIRILLDNPDNPKANEIIHKIVNMMAINLNKQYGDNRN